MKKENVETVKTTSNDWTYLCTLSASMRSFEAARTKLSQRIAALDAAEELEELIRRSKELLDGMLMTLPEPKRETYKNQMNNIFWYMSATKPVVPIETETIIRTSTLGALVKSAHMQCMLCETQNRCNSCELGKAFDRCVLRDRGKKESWADIDIVDEE